MPDGYIATARSTDNNIVDTTSENNLSHDGNGTTVQVKTTDNLTVDFGFRVANTVLGTTTCSDMIINDNTQAANENNATTTIDVLANDSGSKTAQRIKFLSLDEGKVLWENQESNLTTIKTLDTLTVVNEGTWSIQNDKVVFTALTSFDGKIPTPVYYVVEGGVDCTTLTRYSNIGKITINTPCTCPSYTTKSVSTYNTLSIILLILLTLTISIYINRKDI